ncbi:MAG: hypothetical protein HG424_001010 [candidate division SR1 bacterium]|jgi:hypothetical protein|nr:hypothetical protein [candidate division SR1 bacterium]RKW25083.1 MAG: hypothetical protein D8B45_01290 [Candidatus Gracilibacteria bacterium]DAN52348.1 MAG TPA: hypothetical protein [Caudoviricetes sp.]DAS07712.1 MAG TPA: hypothetical protein [Caudoviricetes sp.]DAW70259.1 MAG TPA: hypothetical protein [Caudoviricetes sp.]
MDGITLAYIIRYLQKSKSSFINGTVRFASEDNKMQISYTHNLQNLVIKKTISGTRTDMLHQIQDFCIDCYFDFEWTGQALTPLMLADLFGTTEGYARVVLNRIYKKLKKHEKQFLSEI